LEPLLSKDGFTVLNGGKAIYFPGHGNQAKFKSQLAAALTNIELLLATLASRPSGNSPLKGL